MRQINILLYESMTPKQKAIHAHLFINRELPEHSFIASDEMIEVMNELKEQKKLEVILFDFVFLKENWYRYSTHEKISNFFEVFKKVASNTKIEMLVIVGSFRKMHWLADYHRQDIAKIFDVLYLPDVEPVIVDKRKEPSFPEDHIVVPMRTEAGEIVFGSHRVDGTAIFRKPFTIEASPN